MRRKTGRGMLLAAMIGCIATACCVPSAVMAVRAQPCAGEWIHETNAQGGEGDFWYEDGVRQGVRYHEDGTVDLSYRGREIYDPASDAWYWLDGNAGGKKAVSKDVYQESEAGAWGEQVLEDGTGVRIGKWVRYDENGHMVKGWDITEDGSWYFDLIYGTMAKGTVEIQGITYTFDTLTGKLSDGREPVLDGWYEEGGLRYWYENGVRQGMKRHGNGTPDLTYRGKEIYDPESDAWYWLDNLYQGAMAKGKDVYQESEGGAWSETVNAAGQHVGKWVRYDENGHMVKGWDITEDGSWYFDLIYGTMAKGLVTIDGKVYDFDVNTGKLKGTEDQEGALEMFAPKTAWEYVKFVDTDKDGAVISYTEREFSTIGGTVALRRERVYNAQGELTGYQNYNADGYLLEAMYSTGSVRDVITYEYDRDSHRLLWQIMRRNGTLYDAYEYRYDQNGDYSRIFYYQYDAGGEKVPYFYVDYTYEDGCMTKYARYELGRRGKFYISEQKQAQYKTYGNTAFVVQEEIICFAENGDVTSREKTEYQRDDAGILQESICYYGYRGNEYHAVSHTYYTYDENGNNTMIEIYNYKNGAEVLSDRKEYIYSPYCYTEEGTRYSGTQQTAYHIWTFYIYDGDDYSIGDVDFYRGWESFYSDAFVQTRENLYKQGEDKKPVINYFYLYQYNDTYADTREHAKESYLLSRQKYDGDGQLESTRTYYYQKFQRRGQN